LGRIVFGRWYAGVKFDFSREVDLSSKTAPTGEKSTNKGLATAVRWSRTVSQSVDQIEAARGGPMWSSKMGEGAARHSPSEPADSYTVDT